MLKIGNRVFLKGFRFLVARSDWVYLKTPFFPTSGKETRRNSRRSVAWLAALKHQSLGEHQRHTMSQARHRKDTVQDHLVQRSMSR